jgi:hypothetical protein
MMKMYTFKIRGSDFGGWVFADTPENAKKAISKMYGEEVRNSAILTEVIANAVAFGSYPWESGYSCAEYSK